MLPGEPSLPEAILALNGQAVNHLFDALCQDADRWLKEQFTELFKALQARWFSNHGPICPRCSGQHVIRKGWRQRRLKSSRGQLEFSYFRPAVKRVVVRFGPLRPFQESRPQGAFWKSF
jgi:hypothetical protein